MGLYQRALAGLPWHGRGTHGIRARDKQKERRRACPHAFETFVDALAPSEEGLGLLVVLAATLQICYLTLQVLYSCVPCL